MSNHLTSLAYKLDVGSLLRKSVLVMLADKASDDGSGIWASKQTMADELCCTKQAIIKTVRAFIAEGILKETGQRQHANGHTVTYALNEEALNKLPRVKRWAVDRSTTDTGQPDLPVNDDDATGKPGLPKPPLTAHSPTVATQPTEKRARDVFPAPHGVPDQVWRDFLKSPKRMKAGMSQTAYAAICNNLRQLAEHGYPPGEMVALAVERGWTTIKLEWVVNDERISTNRGAGQAGRLGGHQPADGLSTTRRAAERVFGIDASYAQ